MGKEPLTQDEIDEQNRRQSARFLKQQELENERLANSITAQKLFDTAKRNGHWIYDPQPKAWYTPEEFIRLYGPYYSNHPLLIRVKLKSPLEGLKAGYKQVENLNTKLQLFNEKVVAYFINEKPL